MHKYILVIDEGTTGTRAIIFDETLQIAGQAYHEFTQYTPADNMVEHDAVEIYNLTVSMCHKAVENAGLAADDIDCIGITNQRNTAVIWDKDTGIPFYHALVWQDSRMGEECDAISNSSFFEELLHISGKVIAPHTDVLFLKWYMENVPCVKERMEAGKVMFGTIDTWLVWKMTKGKTYATSYSNASSTGCMDVKEEKWYEELFDYVGVPSSVFPEIKSESADYGMTDILSGREIPITGVIADQQSALFAEGCLEAGSVKCTNGTGSFMDINVGHAFQASPGGVDTLIAWKLGNQTTYMMEGFAPVTGSAVQWLRDGIKIIENAKEVEKLALSVEDTNGVCLVPAFSGLKTPYDDPFARGLMIGLSRGTTEAHIARATLESIAYSIKDILNIAEQNGISIKEIMIDGGASKNDLLAQLIADYTAAKIVRPASLEATALGAACMAGIYRDIIRIEDVKKIAKEDSVFTPKIDEKTRSDKYIIWKEAVSRSRDWIKR